MFFFFFFFLFILFFMFFLSLLLQCKFANSTLLSLLSFSDFITPYDAQASSAFSALIYLGTCPLYIFQICADILQKFVQIYKHSLLMLENKNLNSIKIINEGWGEWVTIGGEKGAGRQLFCFKNKNLVS